MGVMVADERKNMKNKMKITSSLVVISKILPRFQLGQLTGRIIIGVDNVLIQEFQSQMHLKCALTESSTMNRTTLPLIIL